jgi:serine/threonine protein kinase
MTTNEMNAERWQRLTQIVNDCLELPASARETQAYALCAGDDSLYGEAMQWIATAEQTQGFLDEPVNIESFTLHPMVENAADRIDTALSWIGKRLGAYRITEEIARGGMGSVFKAVRDDDQYKKDVAIKVIRPGMDTRLVVERFKAERQILASLDHPNIARLIDGGTTEDDVPYFVMDYVDGESIDRHCARKHATLNERLQLFRTVCSAVHFAHQRLVVHRDLKPSNILVDKTGQIKLLDFGIAKLLDPATIDDGKASAAPTIANAMTPAYASPEQIKGEAITTASDVYALGIVLYRLLTGRSPYKSDVTQPLALAKEIVETDPERPSTIVTRTESSPSAELSIDTTKIVHALESRRLRRDLRGDLDNIVLMALRKDPARRYVSAEQLSEDTRRYLEDMPIFARADTFVYRATKFVGRNRFALAFVSLAFVGLIAGVLVAVQQASVARNAQARAEKHFASARSAANTMVFEVHDAIQFLSGATSARKTVLDSGLKYFDALASDNSEDPKLLSELGAGYRRLAQLQGAPNNRNLGSLDGALASYLRATEMLERAHRLLPNDPSVALEYTKSQCELARVQHDNKAAVSPRLAFEEAIATGRTFATNAQKHFGNRVELAQCMIRYAYWLSATAKDVEQCIGVVNDALRILLDTPTTGQPAAEIAIYERRLGLAYGTLAEYERDRGDALNDVASRSAYEKSLAWAKRAFDLAQRLATAAPSGDAGAKHNLAVVSTTLAAAYSNVDDIAQAVNHYQRAAAIHMLEFQRDPSAMDVRALAFYTSALLAEEKSKLQSASDAFVAMQHVLDEHSQLPAKVRESDYVRFAHVSATLFAARYASTIATSDKATLTERKKYCRVARQYMYETEQIMKINADLFSPANRKWKKTQTMVDRCA